MLIQKEGMKYDGEDISHNEIGRSMESRVGNIDDYCRRCIRYFAYSKWSQAVKEKIRSAILI
jgi:hypothetical protein